MPTSETQWTWQCDQVIPSDTAVGRELLDIVLHQLEALHWPRRDIFAVHLAVDEALVNAVVHGNHSDRHKQIHFCCWVAPHLVRVKIADQGAGFNPDCLPDPTDCAHIDCPRGRGVMLMRAFMSNVEFHDGGKCVVLEKQRLS